MVLRRLMASREINEKGCMTMDFPFFTPETFCHYGPGNALDFARRPTRRHAERMKKPGEIMTREGLATYGKGDWIVTDEQGGKYPVRDAIFRKLYYVSRNKTTGMFKARPRIVAMFRTDKELEIRTEWGVYKADAGDWVVLNKDGSFGCPVKPDAVASGYRLVLPVA